MVAQILCGFGSRCFGPTYVARGPTLYKMLKYYKPISTATAAPQAGSKRGREEAPESNTENNANSTSVASSSLNLHIDGAAHVSASLKRSSLDLTDTSVPSLAATAVTGSSSATAPASGLAALPPADAVASLQALGIRIHPSWAPVVLAESKKAYFPKLTAYVAAQRAKAVVYPSPENVYSALALTPLDSVAVVILGQDPYHGPGLAHGLAFSVQKGVQTPPSLVNMLKEVDADIGPSGGIRQPSQKHGNLAYWAQQGVLLLNAVLTVTQATPNSHQGQGWEEFTSAIVKAVNERQKGVVFMLWGLPAQKKGALVSRAKHCVLEAPHPSPLSAHRGFLGCKHFSKANEYLKAQGRKTVDWSLDPPA